VRRWTDEQGCQRYTAAPSEVSLVDLPCLPQARFEMIKTDGSSVLRSFGRGLDKGLDLVARFAELVDDLDDIQNAAAVEATTEGDGSTVPEQLQDLMERASAILRAMTNEETNELSDGGTSPVAFDAQPVARVTKAGARNSAADLDRIQSVHDTSVDLGAQCGARKNIPVAFEKRFDDLAGKVDDLLLRVKNIESQPMPLPLASKARAVSKHEDGKFAEGESIEKLLTDPDQLALLAIKMAQRNGRNILPR
jgi:hypothetical protein